jgi:hypothetical protein
MSNKLSVGFVANKLEHIFLQVHLFFLSIIITPMIHIYVTSAGLKTDPLNTTILQGPLLAPQFR